MITLSYTPIHGWRSLNVKLPITINRLAYCVHGDIIDSFICFLDFFSCTNTLLFTITRHGAPADGFILHAGILYLPPTPASLTMFWAAYLKDSTPIMWYCLAHHGTSSAATYRTTSWQHMWTASRPIHDPIRWPTDGALGQYLNKRFQLCSWTSTCPDTQPKYVKFADREYCNCHMQSR
mgnify:CR=1 FL=1